MNAKRFRDGLVNIVNTLANRRNPAAQNVPVTDRMQWHVMRAWYASGMGRRIINLKRGYALNDTLQFKTEADRLFHNKHLAKDIKKATGLMLGFGRAIIVIIEPEKNLADPLSKDVDFKTARREVFGGDMVTVIAPDIDLRSQRYMKPQAYSVRGHTIHHSRVIDFTYVEPAEYDLPNYQYGGISEFELISEQLANDAVVQRAGGRIIEINSTIFHKIKGWKDMLMMGKDDDIVKYVSTMADLRGIYGDGIIDSEDDVIEVSQVLTNLKEVDEMSLRRVGLVTGLPYPILVGESVGGLNSIGSQERQSFQDTIENLQSDYIAAPLAQYCALFGLDDVQFKENQGGTAGERMDYETKAIDNAVKLWGISEDYSAYLQDKDVIQPPAMNNWFPDHKDEPDPVETEQEEVTPEPEQ